MFRAQIENENKNNIFETIKLSPLTKSKDIYKEMRSWDTTESRAIQF